MPSINVQLTTTTNSITATLAPLTQRIPHGPQQVTLQWSANAGATFPANAVSWKPVTPGAPQPPNVQNPRGATQITAAPYTNSFETGVTWSYAIQIESNGRIVTIDPDIENDPPPTPPRE